MAAFVETSFGQLIEQAVAIELVDYCYVARSVVTLSIGGKPLSFSTEEARSFLSTLLAGWSRHQASQSIERESKRADAPSITSFSHLFGSRPDAPRSSREATPFPEVASERHSEVSIEVFLDHAVAYAKQLKLIKSCFKNRSMKMVQLHTWATTIEMSYEETLEYLLQSILDELRGAPGG